MYGGFQKWGFPKIMAFNTKYRCNDLWMIWGAPYDFFKTCIFVGSSNVTVPLLDTSRTSQSVQSVFLARFGIFGATKQIHFLARNVHQGC